MLGQSLSVPDYSNSIIDAGEDMHRLRLLVDGMHCAACGFLIERLLQKDGVNARVNITEKRLHLEWKGPATRYSELLQPVLAQGYRLTAAEDDAEQKKEEAEGRFLLLCLAVAGFASGNIMLLSLGLWTSSMQAMGMATRDVLHWFSALIALPTVAFSGRPFFRSAFEALKKGRANMDVPISLGVILACAMSVVQTLHRAEHAYFDSAVMLLFFLLIGRYLDFKMRGRARSAARDVLMLINGDATVMENGAVRLVPAHNLAVGMIVLVAVGEKVLADGIVIEGSSEVDTALLTGETLPRAVAAGDTLHLGMVNLGAPLKMRIVSEKGSSWLAEVVRLMENAKQANARYVRLADRVARYYTPVVHILALSTFSGWFFFAHADWTAALLAAIAVLIITCPCALGLAVPITQIVASNRLFRAGILLKSGDALEKLDEIDTIIFDKTGTLTVGQPSLVNREEISDGVLQEAASLAVHSRHPLSRAIVAANTLPVLDISVQEKPGLGIEAYVQGALWRLGSAKFCEVESPADGEMELWFRMARGSPIRFVFQDSLREDAIEVCQELQQRGYELALYSGDRSEVARAVGERLNLQEAYGGMTAREKHDAVAARTAKGHKILYVGDGLNDAAALSAGHVSISPASGMGVSQNAADVVFQGARLAPVLTCLNLAHRTQKVVRQNIALALIYNVFAVPLAMMGLVTPLIAALAMSCSSLIVILNSLRLQRGRL